LLNPEQVAALPTVRSWLRNAEAALSVAQALHGTQEALLDLLIQQNVLLQMNHLKTHPSIAGALAKGKVEVSGWVYDIGSGTVSVYDEGTRKFEPVKELATP